MCKFIGMNSTRRFSWESFKCCFTLIHTYVYKLHSNPVHIVFAWKLSSCRHLFSQMHSIAIANRNRNCSRFKKIETLHLPSHLHLHLQFSVYSRVKLKSLDTRMRVEQNCIWHMDESLPACFTVFSSNPIEFVVGEQECYALKMFPSNICTHTECN